MAKKLKLQDFEKEVQHLDPKMTNPQEDSFRTAVLLLAALQETPNILKLTKFTGYPREFVRERVQRARKAKIFVGAEVACEWFEENGGIAFWCDVLVVEGLLSRTVGA